MSIVEQTNSSVINIDFDDSNKIQFIKRKTLRGRKLKYPLPDSERCSICLEFEEYSDEKLISCSLCKGMLHPSCYNEKLSKEDCLNFICLRCKDALNQKKNKETLKCFICDTSEGILFKNTSTGEYFHSVCVKLIPELENENGIKDNTSIRRENVRKWRYKNSCKYCQERLNKDKAVIKCLNTKCKDYYHIPCAIEKGMIFSIKYLLQFYKLKEESTVPFFCSCHNKKLALSYRNDIICNVKFCKFIEVPKRKESISTNEDNNTLLTPKSNINKEEKESLEEDIVLRNYEEINETNKIMELNFNQFIKEKSKPKENLFDSDKEDISTCEYIFKL